MQTRDAVKGMQNRREFSSPLRVQITRCKHGKKSKHIISRQEKLCREQRIELKKNNSSEFLFLLKIAQMTNSL